MRALLTYLRALAGRWRAAPAGARYAAGGLALGLLAGAVVWAASRAEAPAPPLPASARALPEARRLLAEQREIERALEQNIVDLLEPALGPGTVIAKVNVTLDRREVESTADSFDPDNTVVRSESDPTQKSYEVGKTTTRIVSRSPRLARLSAAVLVSAVRGAPRAAEEVQRLSALAKHAVGFDAARGDRFEMSSGPFASAAAGAPGWKAQVLSYAALGAAALVLLVAAAGLIWRDRRARPLAGEAAPLPAAPATPDPLATRERARRLVEADPTRAAHLLRAWIAVDSDLKDNRA
jgi:flagellar M-ring protein FliF